jgi:hypothetical protein
MNDKTPTAEPTAASLKNELKESLALLAKDFESLKHFVTELASDGSAAPRSLTTVELHDLLSVTLEIRDAASDIEFEADKIREILDRLIMTNPR